MTDLLSDQILQLAFNPAEKRDRRGRWTRGAGALGPGEVFAARRKRFDEAVRQGHSQASAIRIARGEVSAKATARIGNIVTLPDGRTAVIRDIGPPGVPRGQVHVVVADGKTVPSGFNYRMSELGLKEPIGPSGVLPQSQRFGGRWTPTSNARANKAMGWPSQYNKQKREHEAQQALEGQLTSEAEIARARVLRARGMSPDSIRDQLGEERLTRQQKQRRAVEREARRLAAAGHGPETIRSMLKQNRTASGGVIPWTPDAELRKKQHANRRAALATWTVDEQGQIVRGAHPGVHGQAILGDLPGKLRGSARAADEIEKENREAARQRRQLKRDVAAVVHIPSQHWKFIRMGDGLDIKEVTEPQVGDKALLPLGKAGNQVGTVISVGGGHAVIDSGDDGYRYLVDWRNGGRVIRKDPLSQVAPGARPGSSRPAPGAGGNRYFGMKFRPLAGSAGEKLVAFDNNANPDKPWLIYSTDGSPDRWVSDAELAKLEAPPVPPSPPGVMVAPGVKQYLLPGMPEVPEDDPALARLEHVTKSELLNGQIEYPHQGIQGSVEIVTLSDGTQVVHKKYNSGYEDMADADVLTSEVSRVIEAGAPPVVKLEDGEVIEGFVDGEMAEGYPDYEELYDTPEGRQIGLLDYLSGNSDRHDENWMVTPDGTPVPIDNGGFLGYGSTTSDFWDGYQGDQDEYDQTNEGLTALKPEFERLGRLDWYRDMMSRWMDIAPTAYGYASDLLGIELTGFRGHHIPGTPIMYRHGWVPVVARPAAPQVESLRALPSRWRKDYYEKGELPSWMGPLTAAAPIVEPTAPPGTELAEQQRLLSMWTRSFRYSNTTQGTARDAEFINELHRMLTDTGPPGDECGPGCQDAHSFLEMIDKTATTIPTPMARGISLPEGKIHQMFPVGGEVDMPLASWSKHPETAESYAAKQKAAPDKVHVILHATPGWTGTELTPIEKGGGSWLNIQAQQDEVLTGGRLRVEMTQWQGDVFHVFFRQEVFHAQ